MTAIVIDHIDGNVLAARIRREALRKARERFNHAQDNGFRITIGDLVSK